MREDGRGERGSAVTCSSPRGEAPRFPGCEGMPGRGGRAHAHSQPRRGAGPHPPSTPSAAAGAKRRGRAARGSTPHGAQNCHQPAQLATPSPAAATRPSRRRMPPRSPHIFRQPQNWLPRTLAVGLPLKAEGPRDRGGKLPNSMTRWVSSTPYPPRKPTLQPVANGDSTA